MSLAAGARLGPYEIVSAIGAGGMGEVYRARDTRLHRDVAIKVLPDLFASDPDRLARFEREAQVLASLHHPHIASIFGLEESPSTGSGQAAVRALVMELVEGDDLAHRITRGPIPFEEALPIARQIAEALEAAHDAGVIHRDLKPANIKVQPDGTVKVLDFGLAKALEPSSAEALLHKAGAPGNPVAQRFSAANSPTITSPAAMTAAGIILGTAAYMAPEQARGKPVDKRTDIWAFGCVLFEMLSGQRAFEGPTVSDLIAAVLTREPGWSLLPATTPASVRQLLTRCLDRDPKRRLRDIGEARFVLENPSAGPAAAAGAAPGPAPVWRRAMPWGVAALMAGIAGVATWESRRAPAPSPLTARFAITLPPDGALAFEDLGDTPALVLSPDGSRLVYVARRNGIAQLYVRDLDRLEARLIPGTDDARGPFFSPDGQWIGFFTGGELKKVSLGGGAPQVICPTPPVPRGASWGPDDTIIFAPQQATGLVRVPAASRAEDAKAVVAPAARAPTALEPEGLPTVTLPDAGRGERAHLWPEILPGGKAVLFTIATSGTFDDAVIAVQSLETGERRILIKGGTNARYAPSGHLVYARAGALLAVPFDLARLETTAPPVTVVEGVRIDPRSGAAQFSLSASGSLVYVAGSLTSRDRTLMWVDRRGRVTPLTDTRLAYSYPSLSPDGQQLAFTMQRINQDVWVHDLDRGVQTRLTFGPAENWGAIWTPDSRRLIFSTHGPSIPNLFWMAADGSGTPERLSTRGAAQFAGSVSPDGRVLAFTEETERGADIWLLPLQGAREARLHIGTPYREQGPMFSPDGRWLAYVSNESGRLEVYVQPFPGPGAKRQVSTDGGVAPVWGRHTRELFYRLGDRTLAVTFSAGAEFRPSTPRVLFEGVFEEHGVAHWSRNYDVAPGGERFVMVKGSEEPPRVRIDVVLNWSSELSDQGQRSKVESQR